MNKNDTYSSSLILDDIKLNINLGVTQEERQYKQEILLNIKIYFKDIIDACKNDEIEDTICYDKLTRNIKEYCEDKEFKLIEHLTFEINNILKRECVNAIKISTEIIKSNTPIAEFLKSARFKIENIITE